MIGPSRRRRLLAAAAVWLAAGTFGLAVTVFSAGAAEHLVYKHARGLMDRHAAALKWGVIDQTRRYLDLLSDVAASTGSHADLTAADFNGITAELDPERLPGAAAIYFVVPVRDSALERTEARWRSAADPDFQLVPDGHGMEHLFVIFGRAIAGVGFPVGRDLGNEAGPADAMLSARSHRETAASRVRRTEGPLTGRGQPVRPTFELATPVIGGAGTPDAGAFRGWILMELRAADLISSTLRARAGDAVNAEVLDEAGPAAPVAGIAPGTLIASTADRRLRTDDPLLQERDVAVGRQTWRLVVVPAHGLISSTDRQLPLIVTAIGVVLTALLAALVGVLLTARGRALAKVDRATAALRADIEQRKVTETRLREQRERLLTQEARLLDQEAQLRFLAYHDPLTGLANRAMLQDRAEQAISGPQDEDGAVAMFFVDLDRFKAINDRLGHGAGDDLLVQTAARLRQSVRAEDTVARLGGDEFAILAEGISKPSHAEAIARRMLRSLSRPFDLGGRLVTVTGSVGVTLRQIGETTIDELLRSADDAMYAAKAGGRSRYLIFAGSRSITGSIVPDVARDETVAAQLARERSAPDRGREPEAQEAAEVNGAAGTSAPANAIG